MATKNDVIRRAAALSVAVEFCHDNGNDFRNTSLHEIVLTAPDGKRFIGTQLHENVVASQVDGAPMATLYGPALDDMRLGLEPCDDEDCEWCHDDGADAYWDTKVSARQDGD